MSILFAATYPDRCQALVLYGSYPHFFSFVTPKEKFEAFLEKLDLSWGEGLVNEAEVLQKRKVMLNELVIHRFRRG